jgi:hypothetical protein
MSEERNGPSRGNGNGLGGVGGSPLAALGGLGGAPLGQNGVNGGQPSGQARGDQIAVPGVGNIDRGDTAFHAEHNYNKAVYRKLQQAKATFDHIRVEMDKLVEMGDTVSPEDVVAAAGRVVGHGVPAGDMASLLAQMPTMAGQGLAAWLAQQDQAVRAQELHVEQVSRIAQGRLAASAFRGLAAEHVMQRGRERTAANALMQRGAPAAAPGSSPGALGAAPAGGGMPQPQVIQMARAPERQGPGAEEAV